MRDKNKDRGGDRDGVGGRGLRVGVGIKVG